MVHLLLFFQIVCNTKRFLLYFEKNEHPNRCDFIILSCADYIGFCPCLSSAAVQGDLVLLRIWDKPLFCLRYLFHILCYLIVSGVAKEKLKCTFHTSIVCILVHIYFIDENQ